MDSWCIAFIHCCRSKFHYFRRFRIHWFEVCQNNNRKEITKKKPFQTLFLVLMIFSVPILSFAKSKEDLKKFCDSVLNSFDRAFGPEIITDSIKRLWGILLSGASLKVLKVGSFSSFSSDICFLCYLSRLKSLF